MLIAPATTMVGAERRLTGESRMLLRVEPCPNRKPQQPQHTNRKPPEHHWKQAEHAYGQADKQRRGDVAESQSPWLDERKRTLQHGG